ncbi:MAG: glycosyl hydrolase, partial [Elainella sp.]
QNQKIPARINLRGYATARYEATSQYAMLYPALLLVDQDMATEVRQKLLATYKNGIWDNDQAYYVQNLAWFGLFPAEQVKDLVQPR